ncbi:MAG TPA: hypothetical protein VN721_03125 [Flavipsychrobacter sp.]|nr:hypothetical protein [Flavipsychrobacter sp.]
MRKRVFILLMSLSLVGFSKYTMAQTENTKKQDATIQTNKVNNQQPASKAVAQPQKKDYFDRNLRIPVSSVHQKPLQQRPVPQAPSGQVLTPLPPAQQTKK